MCIRDRYRIAVIPGDGIGKEVVPEGLRVLEVAAKKHGVSAVSYTHLRAHETVLDLVCRLLLEKKK